MTTITARTVDPRRLALLQAIGIDVYRLRGRASSDFATPVADAVRFDAVREIDAPASARARIAIVCAADDVDAAAPIVRALGVAPADVHWVRANGTTLEAIPTDVGIYLVLGDALARPFGAELPTAARQRATVAVTGTARSMRADPVVKRALWQALRPLLRALRAAVPQ